MEDKKLFLKISNTSKSKMVLIIEPWAVQNTIESNSSYEFFIEGPTEKLMEIEHKENEIIIHGWADSTTSAKTEI
ncbi:MAG: hypothetical protein ACR2F2_12510 [Pyrinomonadaceae bacterium]